MDVDTVIYAYFAGEKAEAALIGLAGAAAQAAVLLVLALAGLSLLAMNGRSLLCLHSPGMACSWLRLSPGSERSRSSRPALSYLASRRRASDAT